MPAAFMRQTWRQSDFQLCKREREEEPISANQKPAQGTSSACCATRTSTNKLELFAAFTNQREKNMFLPWIVCWYFSEGYKEWSFRTPHVQGEVAFMQLNERWRGRWRFDGSFQVWTKQVHKLNVAENLCLVIWHSCYGWSSQNFKTHKISIRIPTPTN